MDVRGGGRHSSSLTHQKNTYRGRHALSQQVLPPALLLLVYALPLAPQNDAASIDNDGPAGRGETVLFVAVVVCVLPVTLPSRSPPPNNLRIIAEPGTWPGGQIERQASRDEGIQPCER